MSKKNLENKGFSTQCIHAGQKSNEHRSHITPIYASSTYLMDDAQYGVDFFTGKRDAYIYGRFGNPNTNEVEDKIAALETYNLKDSSGHQLKAKAILHASGMAAISTCLLATLQAGEKILTHFSLYGGTQELIDKVLPALNIEATLCDFKQLAAVEQQLENDKTIQLIYIETPANPSLACVDIEAICTLAKKHRVKVMCDNTFATPYLQQPFAFGVDYIIHSTTKFLNGHGTAIGGVLLGTDLEFMNTKMTKHHRLLGGNANPFDTFLLNTGVKTLALRMEKHCSNAEQVAQFLEAHKAVEKVNYLGLESHEDYAVAKKQMKHAGAMLSFIVKGDTDNYRYENAKLFIDNLNLTTHAVSLGTVDTLISHPASTTHVGVTAEVKQKSGITDGLIRVSVGLENIEDIITDIENALKHCNI
jgi:methionine-gamma-lyase